MWTKRSCHCVPREISPPLLTPKVFPVPVYGRLSAGRKSRAYVGRGKSQGQPSLTAYCETGRPILRRTCGLDWASNSSTPDHKRGPDTGKGHSRCRLSALWDRIFGENLFRSFERLVRCRLGRHSVGDDVVPGHLKDMLGIDLGSCRVERQRVSVGLLTLYIPHIPHTSASLLIQENASPDVRGATSVLFCIASCQKISRSTATMTKGRTTCRPTSRARSAAVNSTFRSAVTEERLLLFTALSDRCLLRRLCRLACV
jgi:hypothetical protein